MPDVSAILQLPYLQPSQAQKHVTHNEALRLLDLIVQIAVENAVLAAPPPAPTQGQRWIVAGGASGDWTGEAGRIAARIDGAWMFVVPQDGWIAWDRAEGRALVHRGPANVWEPLVPAGTGGGAGGPEFADDAFAITGGADASRRLRFDVAGLPDATTRVLTAPAADGAIAILGALPQTFAGPISFASAAVDVGTAPGPAAYGLGTGATAATATKAVNLGTNGLEGSTTVVTVGPAAAGAGGRLVVNTPLVQFGPTVAAVAAPQAALTAAQVGVGGAVPDDANRLSVNAPATLLNHDGAGHEVTVNKAAPSGDAALAFKTGFSARALIGLLGGDDFAIKVSAAGAAYVDALVVDRATGRVELPAPLVLPAVVAQPTAPQAGRLALYARSRAGQPFAEVARPQGRDYPLQPHAGQVRVAAWLPLTGTTIGSEGLPLAGVGTVSTPALTAASLATSIRRWRVTSAAVANSVADQRSPVFACWRGNAPGLGGFTLMTRVSLAVLQPTGMGFFGLLGSAAALPVTQTLAALLNAIGVGFERGTHANWQLVANDAAGAPTLTDLGAGFGVAVGGVMSIHLAATPNAASVWARVVNDVTGAVLEAEIGADLPAAAMFLAPRLFLGTGATAAAVAYDTTGLYLETDY